MNPQNTLFTTRGLFLSQLADGRHIVQDVFGTCSLPFEADSTANLGAKLLNDFGIRALVDVRNTSEFPSFSEFNWNQLEFYYVAHLEYSFHDYLMNVAERAVYHDEKLALPVAYLELGHGDGARSLLELIDRNMRTAAASGKAAFRLKTLETWLVICQFQRICSEMLSLISRAITAFVDLLRAQRECINSAAESIVQLGANEVIHHGRSSYNASTAASMATISMCTSLDLLSKLIHYLDQVEPLEIKFKPAGGRHFADLTSFRGRHVSKDIAGDLMRARSTNPAIAELIQFRNDIVHSTSALELEKVYVGVGNEEVKGAPLHYSFQGWRDCLPSGQPERYLGRDFFVSKGEDIEHRVFTWLQEVIKLQLTAGQQIHEFLAGHPMT